jgi:argininosuccinate lyase
LDGLSISDLQSVEPRTTIDAFRVLTVESSVRLRKSFGGTAPINVSREAKRWLKILKGKRP